MQCETLPSLYLFLIKLFLEIVHKSINLTEKKAPIRNIHPVPMFIPFKVHVSTN